MSEPHLDHTVQTPAPTRVLISIFISTYIPSIMDRQLRSQRHLLRQLLKEKRLNLTAQQRKNAADRLHTLIRNADFFLQAQHIAYYFAHSNEIDLSAIWQDAQTLGKKNYLPAIQNTPDSPLLFLPYQNNTPLKSNRYGIPEPHESLANAMPPDQLDLVFAPLLGFDITGNRIGMGAGFYDRTFNFLKNTNVTKPLLVGVGYECQKVPLINAEPWDVKLHAIITEKTIYWSKTS